MEDAVWRELLRDIDPDDGLWGAPDASRAGNTAHSANALVAAAWDALYVHDVGAAAENLRAAAAALAYAADKLARMDEEEALAALAAAVA